MGYVAAFVFCTFALLTTGSFVEGRKEIPSDTPFPQRVQDAIGCDLCAHAVSNIHLQVEKLRKEAALKRLKLREDEVLTAMERSCNPFMEEGEWARRVLILLTRPEKNQKSIFAVGNSDVRTAVLSYYSRCKRNCFTVKNMCEYIMDQSELDPLPATLLQAARNGEDITDEDLVRESITKVCYPLEVCRNRAELSRNLNKELNSDQDPEGLRAEIEGDVPERIDADEMEMERLMRKMWEEDRRKSDVFPRDEITQLQDAIRRGDREAAKKLDPKSMDLTEEEFEELQAIFNAEQPGFDDGLSRSTDL